MATDPSSRSWLHYFRANQGEPAEIPWSDARRPPGYLIASLQQFQLGEGATGAQFLAQARAYALPRGDRDFPEAIALFIAEEQRHSALLARYLRTVGAPLLARHWIHGVFRRLRKLAGLECMVAVLVTAEIIAVPYYRAVYRTCGCPALRAICRRVLREEAQHLLFQASTLARFSHGRASWAPAAVRAVQTLFLAGTCVAVWAEHRRVFGAAGRRFGDLWRSARAVLRHVQRASAPAMPPTPARLLEFRSASSRYPAR